MDKEHTFVKIVERTCKRDAYRQALRFGRSESITKEQLMEYLQMKQDGHEQFLYEAECEYEYCTQNLITYFSVRKKTKRQTEVIDENSKQ